MCSGDCSVSGANNMVGVMLEFVVMITVMVVVLLSTF